MAEQPLTNPEFPDLIGIVGGPMIPCKVVEFSATMAPTGVARRVAAGLDACYDQTKRQVVRYQPAPSPTPARVGYVDPQQLWAGQHDPLIQVTVLRWACPLRTCEWAWDFPTEEAGRTAFLRGGVVREHIESHDLLEWAQEVIDLRAERLTAGAGDG